MIEVLRFEDIQGNMHHYNLRYVEDIVKKKDTGKCYVFGTDETQYEITEDEYDRLNGYGKYAPEQ